MHGWYSTYLGGENKAIRADRAWSLPPETLGRFSNFPLSPFHLHFTIYFYFLYFFKADILCSVKVHLNSNRMIITFQNHHVSKTIGNFFFSKILFLLLFIVFLFTILVIPSSSFNFYMHSLKPWSHIVTPCVSMVSCSPHRSECVSVTMEACNREKPVAL